MPIADSVEFPHTGSPAAQALTAARDAYRAAVEDTSDRYLQQQYGNALVAYADAAGVGVAHAEMIIRNRITFEDQPSHPDCGCKDPYCQA